MRNVIYTLIFLLVLFTLFRGLIFDILEVFNIEWPKSANRFFVSKDEGLTWKEKKIKEKNFSDIFFDKGNASKFLLASNGGLLKAEKESDGLWKKNNQSIRLGYFYEVFQNDFSPNNIYLICYDLEGSKILYSNDKGQNFKIILKLDKNDKILSFAVKENILYAGTKNGVLLSSYNGGISWQKIKEFSPQSVISLATNRKNGEVYIVISSRSINLFGTEPPKELISRVFVLKEGKFSEIKNLQGKEIEKVIVSNFGEVYFISKKEIYFYISGIISRVNLISEFKIIDFTIDPKNPNILYVTSKNLLYRSKDKGMTWETVNLPSGIQRIKKIEINPNNSNEILIKAD